MTPDNPNEASQDKAMEQALDLLLEHFDTAQLLTTVVEDDGGTRCRKRGRGNVYARIESCREFVREQDCETDFAVHKHLKEDDGT